MCGYKESYLELNFIQTLKDITHQRIPDNEN